MSFHSNKKINCVDCDKKINRTCPNKKRCKDCAYEEKKRLATIATKNNPELNRKRQKDWYYRNTDYKRRKSLEYYHKRKNLDI